MTDGEPTLGAVLARLEEREREIVAQVEAAREKIAELTALLDGFDTAAEEIPDHPQDAVGAARSVVAHAAAEKLPEHPAYQQIMAVLATADTPFRERAVCEAMDLEISPNNVSNVRLNLKRLVERGILIETEQGLFTRPRP